MMGKAPQKARLLTGDHERATSHMIQQITKKKTWTKVHSHALVLQASPHL